MLLPRTFSLRQGLPTVCTHRVRSGRSTARCFNGKQHSHPPPQPLAASATQPTPPSQPPPEPASTAAATLEERFAQLEATVAKETEELQQLDAAVAKEAEEMQQLEAALAKEREERQADEDVLAAPRVFNLANLILDLHHGHTFEKPSTAITWGGSEGTCYSMEALSREVHQLRPRALRLQHSQDEGMCYACMVILSLEELRARRPDMGMKPKGVPVKKKEKIKKGKK